MEFRPIRRKTLALDAEETERILTGGSYGVLSLSGDGGYPYGVPVNYVYDGKAIYIHSATIGHKVDAITKNSAVSFTVVERHDVRPEQFATSYTSVIVFGIAEFVTDTAGKKTAFCGLSSKKWPEGGGGQRNHAKTGVFFRKAGKKKVPPHISGKRGGGG